MAAGDAHQHRIHSDDRFAAADVALQQPVHRSFIGKIGRHFVDRGPLSGRPLEGKQPLDAGIDIG